MSTPIILASTSPRRRELLHQIGLDFEIMPSNAPEDVDDDLHALDVVRLLAKRKSQAISELRPEAMVIAADTVVSIDDHVLGKPTDAEDAVRTLQRLSGRTHQVLTGVSLKCKQQGIDDLIDVRTDVTFGVLSKELIAWYVATKEPFDKAGSYAIQGKGAVLVKAIDGSYYNVVGLPLYEIADGLRRHLQGQALFTVA